MTKAFKIICGLKEDELKKKTIEMEKELIKVRGHAATGTGQKNPYAIRNMKRMMARILTLSHQQRLEKIKTKHVKTKHE